MGFAGFEAPSCMRQYEKDIYFKSCQQLSAIAVQIPRASKKQHVFSDGSLFKPERTSGFLRSSIEEQPVSRIPYFGNSPASSLHSFYVNLSAICFYSPCFNIKPRLLRHSCVFFPYFCCRTLYLPLSPFPLPRGKLTVCRVVYVSAKGVRGKLPFSRLLLPGTVLTPRSGSLFPREISGNESRMLWFLPRGFVC